jgi:hypothetical protein
VPLGKQHAQGHQEVEIDAAEIHGIYDHHKLDRIASRPPASHLSGVRQGAMSLDG